MLLLIFPVVPVEAVSVDASFDDPRCETDERVCPNVPLLFSCTVTGSTATLATVRLSSGHFVDIRSDNMTSSGGGSLPDGVTVDSHGASVGGGVANYTRTLAIDRASVLNSNSVTCADGGFSPQTAQASCPVATGIYTVAGIHSAVYLSPVLYFTFIHNHAMFGQTGPLIPGTVSILLAQSQPVNLVQNDATNTESSVVVQWQAPEETGGVSISTYTVTVEREGMMVSQNVSGNMLTHNISGLEYNTEYEVEVTTINSCGIPSQPATTTVFIDARS